MKRTRFVTAAVLAVLVLGLLSPGIIERIADRSGVGDTLVVEPIADLSTAETLPVALLDRLQSDETLSTLELDAGRNYTTADAAQRAALLTEGYLERCGLPVKYEELYLPDRWETQPLIVMPETPDTAGWNAVLWNCTCRAQGYHAGGCLFDDTSGAPLAIYLLLPVSVLDQFDLPEQSDVCAAVFADMLGAEFYAADPEQVPENAAADKYDLYGSFSYGIIDEKGNTTVIWVTWQFADVDPESGEDLVLLWVGMEE